MKLNLIRVEQLRQFSQTVEISDLGSGINLFCGPNESGKSTLVAAIRAAFFERHRSTSVDDLQPWGDSSVSPHITLDFDCKGSHWRLDKSFVKQKRCDLQVDGELFSGDEAEEKLAELLGFQHSGRGASKPEHWGIPGLLWIEQGSGQDVRQAVEYAGHHLKSALGASLGEVASSSGDQLIGEVQAQRGVLLTATGRPTGDYAQVIQSYGKLTGDLKELDQKIDTYRAQVDRLGELRARQQQDSTELPWEGFRLQGLEALARLNEVNGWIGEQEREEKNLASCRNNLEVIRDQLRTFGSQADDLGKREKHLRETAQILEELQAQQAQIEASVQNAEEAHTNAREASLKSRQQEQRATIERELKQLERNLADIDSNLVKAREQQAELLEQRERLQANHIDAAKLKKLRKLTGQLGELQIRQQAIATRLQFDLLPGQTIQLNGEDFSGQGEQLLLQPAELEIANLGRLRILPGGEDLADLVRHQQKIQDDIESLLGILGVESLSKAEERESLCKSLLGDIKGNEALLESVAPRGADDVLSEQQLNQSRKGDLEEQLAVMPSLDGQFLSVTVADAQREAAADDLKTAEQAESAYHRTLALAEQAKLNANAEWQGLSDLLQAPDRQHQEQQANQRLMDLRAEEQGLADSLAKRKEQIDSARPDILEQDVNRFNTTADELEKAANQRKLDLARLQSLLEAQGAQGLEEQRAETALECERIGRRHDELRRRAEALDLLLELLTSKRHALTQRLQEPLQKHLNHYLQLLFPHASLSVDENLIPSHLIRPATRGDARDDYDALSFGAREQMGLISRLAYADLLKEAGRPTLIILDDALVHSDEQRLAQMKRILFDAAQRHQILLFSCHPENWRDLGVAARDMHAIRVAG